MSNRQWIKCLGNPKARGESRFIWDLDRPLDAKMLLQVIDPTDLLFCYPTPNGEHVITNPFSLQDLGDTPLFNCHSSDGQILVAYHEGEHDAPRIPASLS